MTTRTQEVPATPLVEDQIREYQHNQRRLYNLQQASRRMGQRIMRRPVTQHMLEQQLDPQEQLRGLIGRLSNTPNVAFTYEVNGVVDYLTSHGVIALPGRRYNTRQLQGLNWVVCPTNRIIPLQPREVSSDNSIDGRLSISFSNYQATPSTRETIYNRNDDEAPSDEEELRLHTIAVLIEERRLLVRRLYPSVALPRRATSGAAGYDLPINRAQDVPVNSRALLTTGLSIKVPDGTYARIVAQSRAALKRGILIGVGVVDFDFRDTSNFDVEDIQDSLNSYFSSAVEGGGEKELPYPTKITPEIVAAGQELEENWELEYPQLARLSEQVYSSSAISPYRPPEDTTMGPPNYSPAVKIGTGYEQRPDFEGYRGNGKFKSKDYSEQWNLPSAFHQTGAMFLIPTELGRFDEVFMRWESVTNNPVSLQGFTDATSKAKFIENLLG
ncbi:hypothetical protein ZIOFF_005755 [Zingiber officinale]|uniref:dUTP diphosphatase n=1 Tax=Zingiber officinale TaxID=94328 RepID=A0A8J5ID19_ZINOF|nr:hypothetical protein ZIOFF_005755 [Zingiber officinale]